MKTHEVTDDIEEIIQDVVHIRGCCWEDGGWYQILSAAIEKLHTHPDAQPNEPLTLEELREMVDQPVWVKAPGISNDISGRWVIVEGVNLDERTIYTRGDFSCHDYGAVWLAYRRPPKES